MASLSTTSITITGNVDPNHPSRTLTGLSRIRWAAKNPPTDPQVTFSGKTVLVTGANTGLGYASALKYAQKGCAKLILAVRSVEKGEDAKRRIFEGCGREEGKGLVVKVLRIDMADYTSIRSFAVELKSFVEEEGGRIDVALLNAGLANPTYTPSPHGHDMAVQVNVLGTALLAHLLFPILQSSAKHTGLPSHLTFVNSIAHEQVEKKWYAGKDSSSLLSLADSKEGWDQKKSYTSVKALGMAVMLHFASLAPSEVLVNACCPFFCKTDLGRNFSPVLKILFGAWQYFMSRSAEEGSRTLVGATALGVEGRGGFWFCDTLYPLGEVVGDKEEMGRCWGDIRAVLRKESGVAETE